MTFRTAAGRAGVALTVLGVFALCRPAPAEDRSALMKVEGVVLEVGRLAGEGGLELFTVRIAGEQVPGGELDLLLAPGPVLEEIGFEVSPGDRLKARVFTSEDGPATVHKARNISRNSMVRLRTLRQTPLWDGRGVWQGTLGQGGSGSGRRGEVGRGTPPSPPGGGAPR